MCKCLEIQLLGGVTVRYGEKEIGMGTYHAKSGKMWTLFKYLVLNSGRIVPQDELIDRLWPEIDVSNPANSLKVLVFKLRRELDSLGGIPGKDLILTADGGYCLNTAAPYRLDIDTFDRYLERARDCEGDEEKTELLLSAVACYKGNIYVEPKRGNWAMPIQTHYYERYETAVRTLAGLLMEKGEYQRVIDLCKNALLIQPYSEDFYYYIIRCYTFLENYSAASDMYKEAQKVMNNEFGTRLDARFESAYRDILKRKPKGYLSAEEIQRDLREKGASDAAFFVEYGEFRQIYRLMARRLDQAAESSYLCVYSLGAQKGTPVSKETRKSHVQLLGEALAFGLRSSDVFCRASASQFAVLLENISEKRAGEVSRRIRDHFDQKKTESRIFVVYHAVPVESSLFIDPFGKMTKKEEEK